MWAAAEELGLPRAHRPEPAGPRAREPRAVARVAARRLRPDGDPDPAADRRREGLPRRRRSRRDEGVDVRRPTAAAKPPRATIPAELATAAQAAREALIEMVAEADDALMEKFFDAGTLTQEELVVGLQARRRRPAASSRCCAPRPPPTSASSRSSTPSSRTCRRRPSARSAAKDARTEDTSRSTAVRQRAGGGVRLEDGGRPVRRTHHDVPRRVGRAQVGLDRAQRDARHARAARAPRAAAGQDADQRRRRSRPATSAPSRS